MKFAWTFTNGIWMCDGQASVSYKIDKGYYRCPSCRKPIDINFWNTSKEFIGKRIWKKSHDCGTMLGLTWL